MELLLSILLGLASPSPATANWGCVNVWEGNKLYKHGTCNFSGKKSWSHKELKTRTHRGPVRTFDTPTGPVTGYREQHSFSRSEQNR